MGHFDYLYMVLTENIGVRDFSFALEVVIWIYFYSCIIFMRQEHTVP